MKVVSTCVLALLAGAASATTATDDGAMPSAREYFFASAYVQVCSGGSVVDTPALKALRDQTAAYYHALFAQTGEDADTKRIIGNIEANKLPNGLVTSIKALRQKWANPDRDIVCKTHDVGVRRQLARHDVALAEHGWPGAKPLVDARAALRAIEGDAVVTEQAAVPPNKPDTARRPRVHTNDLGCMPDFPAAAIERGITGSTRVRFDVDANGQVTAWDIRNSAGPTLYHGLLDFAAVEALSKCSFDPAHDADGRAVQGSADIDYSWHLE